MTKFTILFITQFRRVFWPARKRIPILIVLQRIRWCVCVSVCGARQSEFHNQHFLAFIRTNDLCISDYDNNLRLNVWRRRPKSLAHSLHIKRSRWFCANWCERRACEHFGFCLMEINFMCEVRDAHAFFAISHNEYVQQRHFTYIFQRFIVYLSKQSGTTSATLSGIQAGFERSYVKRRLVGWRKWCWRLSRAWLISNSMPPPLKDHFIYAIPTRQDVCTGERTRQMHDGPKTVSRL